MSVITVRRLVVLFALVLTSVSPAAARADDNGLPLDVIVHLEGFANDWTFREGELAGTRGQWRRLEGFQINFRNPPPGIGLRYKAHLQGIGDTGWLSDGQFIGSRGQWRRLEGFAIELTGPNAAKYDVIYKAHLQDTGDTDWYANGHFCGTRFEGRRVEGIIVAIVPK
jgi:uncharacterized protein YjdB